MQVITPEFVKGKKVLIRYDIDVAFRRTTDYRLLTTVEDGRRKTEDLIVTEDFKLKAGLETLELCIVNASKVIIIGHLGRPFTTVEDEKKGIPSDLSAKPVQEWFQVVAGIKVDFAETLEQAASSASKVVLLENIRFFHGEVPGLDYHTSCTSKTCDIDFAHQLAALGEVYVNEAFSAHNSGASTTMVPALLPHAAGLHFAKEVRVLREVRENPKKPFIAIMGGAKVADKLPVINVLAEKADAVLVGGKLISEIRAQNLNLPKNVMVGMLNEDVFDIAPQTVDAWRSLISKAEMIVWNGPLGKFEDPKNDATEKIARMVLDSGAVVVIGGGDSVAALSQYGLLEEAEQKAFVSVGGGAMLKLLADGTLPTIEALI